MRGSEEGKVERFSTSCMADAQDCPSLASSAIPLPLGTSHSHADRAHQQVLSGASCMPTLKQLFCFAKCRCVQMPRGVL